MGQQEGHPLLDHLLLVSRLAAKVADGPAAVGLDLSDGGIGGQGDDRGEGA
jgi:hypothetical protein